MREEHQISPRSRALAAFILRARRGLFIGALALLAPALYFASQLPVDQNFRRLLPDQAPEILRLDAIDARIGNQSDLILSIEGPEPEVNKRFGAELARRLEAEKEALSLRSVTFRRDTSFFDQNAMLYLSLQELMDLRDDVREKIQEAVRREMDLGLEEKSSVEGSEAGEAETGSLEDDSMSRAKIRTRARLDKQLREYLEADEGRILLLKARPRAASSDLSYAKRLTARVESLIRELDPTSYHPALSVAIKGAFAENTARARSMRSAVLDGTLTCLVILLLSIALYFRSPRAILWILAPLLLSVIAALAFAQQSYGHLNLVSAFIFAILLGLGIDFGVHILSRYREARGGGLEVEEALALTLGTTGVSTAAGALSTAGCFLVLSAANFQGFAQFGVVAAFGVIAALLAAVFLIPALAVGRPRWGARPSKSSGKAHASGQTSTPPSGAGVPKLALSLLILAGVASGYGIWASQRVEFEYDLSKLGSKRSKAKRVGAAAPALPKQRRANWRDALGDERRSAPTIILTENLEETRIVHRQLSVLFAEGEAERAAKSGDAAAPEPRKLSQGYERRKWRQLREKAARAGAPSEEIQAILSRYPETQRQVMRSRINKVFSIYDYVPMNQADKLTIIRDIKRRIDRKRESLTAQEQADLEEWYPYLKVSHTFTADDLPEWVKVSMEDKRGEVGRSVIFWADGRKADYTISKSLRDAFFDIHLRGPGGEDASPRLAPSGAEYFILPAIIDTIRADGPVVSVLAIIVMIIASWLLIGGVAGPLVVLGVVGSAIFWLLGIMYALGWKADLFNLLAIPLLVGMGQDDALHLYHRYREEGPGSVGRAIRGTGSAIFLTTWTTAIGFGGIFFTSHRGLLSLAKVSV
ncbi:MAG: MMPL family transporter, partial [Myxococcota bacterium]|nr:MMPL family transporter [Myxococcota bacterium]